MKNTRLWSSTIAAAALAAGSLATAVAAHAANSLTTSAGSITATVDAGDSLAFCDRATTPADCVLSTNHIYIASASATYTNGSSVLFGAGSGNSGPTSLPSGTFTVIIYGGATLRVSEVNVVIGDGGGGGTTPGSAASAPVEVSLSLDLAASGASCKEGSAATGFAGAWLTLPSADDCSSTTNPKAKLLGWSTSANFPVAMAQSQVEKGWGAIDEVIDGVRMIFIPAGQSTFISGPNSLHPIWAS